jgi:four helix bundle protein
MGNSIRSFEDLECWKASREVRRYVMEVIKKFPSEEKYALIDGMRRSSRSITENIAEGFGRYHYGENIQFCRISRGSLHELIDQFISALDDNYINSDEYDKGREMINKAITILNGYINYLDKAKSSYKNKSSNNLNEDQIPYNE